MCGFHVMRVVRIASVGAIFPDVGEEEALALELGDEFAFLHEVILQRVSRGRR